MLSIRELSISYADRVLFNDVNLILNPKKRYCIVGANGSGKSTLLKIISEVEVASSGRIEKPQNSKVGFLNQDHFKYENDLILEVVLQGKAELWDAQQKQKKLLSKDSLSEEEGLEVARLESIISDQSGYIAETDAQNILQGLGIPEEKHYEEMNILSGGFKIRVLLAQLLFSDPDILLLDEPTNHLDIKAITWLEKFLKTMFRGVLLIVSHDYDFLNNMATNILDIDYETITEYVGNYNKFIAEKALIYEQKQLELKEKEKKITHMQDFVNKFKAKASKARQAQSRVKMIEKMEGDLPEIHETSRRAPVFDFRQVKPSGKSVVKIKEVNKSYGDNQILRNISFSVRCGEKVGIIGPNGIGKSTLLKILLSDITADSGEFEWGHQAQIAYFAQDHKDLMQGDGTILEYLENNTSNCDQSAIRGMLGRMLFPKDAVHKKTSVLSGGEAARVLFAKIQLEQPNIIVLDEPTNHLDLESIKSLEDSLKKYTGTLMVVSHNRHYLQAICNRIIVLGDNSINDYNNENLNLEKICLHHFGDD